MVEQRIQPSVGTLGPRPSWLAPNWQLTSGLIRLLVRQNCGPELRLVRWCASFRVLSLHDSTRYDLYRLSCRGGGGLDGSSGNTQLRRRAKPLD
jgi:hypothetical protein